MAGILADAIESALAQTYSNVEVIVVDDGSTDDSNRVLNAYAGKVHVIRKANGGQASAYNAGYYASCGGVLIFLDADDLLQPTALARAMPSFESPDVVKVHWSLAIADEHGRATGQLYPQGRPAEGDLRRHVCAVGPSTVVISANGAYARTFLHRIFPVPEDVYRLAADAYLFELAPFFGKLVVIDEPQLLYRQHGDNDHVVIDLDVNVQRGIASLELTAPIAIAECRRYGYDADLTRGAATRGGIASAGLSATSKRTFPPLPRSRSSTTSYGAAATSSTAGGSFHFLSTRANIAGRAIERSRGDQGVSNGCAAAASITSCLRGLPSGGSRRIRVHCIPDKNLSPRCEHRGCRDLRRAMTPPIAIVAGYLAGNPVGGHVMSILHWLAGLRQLGYDVIFVEHHRLGRRLLESPHQDPERRSVLRPRRAGWPCRPASGCAAGVSSINRDRYHGLSRLELELYHRSADVMLGL